MSDKKITISEALAAVQRKVNEQRLAQITKMYSDLTEGKFQFSTNPKVGGLTKGEQEIEKMIGNAEKPAPGSPGAQVPLAKTPTPAQKASEALAKGEKPVSRAAAKAKAAEAKAAEKPTTPETDPFGQQVDKDGKIVSKKPTETPAETPSATTASTATSAAATKNPANARLKRPPAAKKPTTPEVNNPPPPPPTKTPPPGGGGSTPPAPTPAPKSKLPALLGAAFPVGLAIGAASGALNDKDTPTASAATPNAAAPDVPVKKVKTVPVKPPEGGFGDAPSSNSPSVTPKPKAAGTSAAPAPKAADAEPEDKHAKSKAMYQQHQDMERADDHGATSAYWRAEAQRAKEDGRTAPNDFSDTAVGKFFSGLGGKKKVNEAIKYLSMNPNSVNMFSEAKKAKKDWDKDGKIESDKDEVWGSRFAAAKKAGKMEEAATSSDPDFAAPRPDGSKKPDDIQYKPAEKKPEDKKVPLPPKRPTNEETDPGFSEEELAHFASIMEANPVSKVDPEFSKSNSNAGKVPARDLTDETIEEARGRPKKNAEPAPGEESGRDPRQHIQVIAGQAAAGRVIDFKHNNGDVSKISPGMGRAIVNKLGNLKPAERQASVNKMHDSAEGLKG